MTGPAAVEETPRGRAVTVALAYGMLNNIALRFGNLLLGVLLARLLAPAEFGVYAVALTVQAVLANLTDLGMAAFIVRTPDVERKAPTVLTAGCAVGVALAAAMWALAAPLADQMGSPAATPVIQALSLTLVLTGAGSVPAAFIQRRLQQNRQLVADGSSFVVGATVAVVLIMLGQGAMSLAWSRVAGQLVAVVLLFRLSHHRPVLGFDTQVAREAVRFGLPLVGANVLSWLLLNMDYVIVGRLRGATVLGIYVLAFNISSWPTSAISQGLRAVALPVFAREQSADASTRTRHVAAAVGLTLAGSALSGALLLALASPVIIAVYGERWAASAAPLATLAAFGAVRPVFDLLATYLTARGATHAVFAVQVAWTVALLPALVVGISWNGPAGAGLAHLTVGLLVVLPAYLLVLRRQEIAPSTVLRAAIVPLTAAAAAGGAAFATGRLLDNPWVAVLAGGSVATLAYAGAMRGWVRRRVGHLRGPGGIGASEGAGAPGGPAPVEPALGPSAGNGPGVTLHPLPAVREES